MGLTDLGNPLTHEDTMKWSKHVKDQGIEQFVNLYNRQKQRQNDPFKWGDETEYTLVKFEDGPKEAKVSLTSCFVLIQINRKNGVNEKFGFWTPEYAAYMLEATPASPYEALNFIAVENNMKNRKKEISECLKNGEEVLCITAFPRLGCEKFTYPETIPTPGEGYTKSLFFADEALFPHPRYKNTTKNVIGRRGGQKAVYNLPIYKDKNTQSIVDESHKLEVQASPHHIYMDTMGFGSGYSCFQVTVQGANIEETKIIYDQWAPFCPIMMALVAAAPFHRGFIADCDTRWKISCNTHDCRTQEEQVNLPKSRFASINYYLTEQGDALNDNPDVFRQEDYQKLIDGGVDKRLAKHVAYLFLRSTISMFKHNTVDQDNTTQTGHFENVHSTNWQSLRFKPPPADGSIGWRVEFRPCDLQTTDFENAAVACFLILLTRIALDYKLNFLIPISKVDENVERAQVPNAVLDKKFWFRKNVDGTQKGAMVNGNASNNEFVEMSMDEIINGKKGGFPGVLSYMRQYVAEQNLEDNNRKRIHQYLRLIEGRASGKILTTAAWMRKFVNEHPDYRHDSIITEKINYDLLKAMQEIQNGTRHCPELLGEDYTMLA